MSPEITPSETELDLEGPEKGRERRRRIIIALLFLLLSFICIFCSSQSALWLIDRSRIDASMLSSLRADYGEDISLDLAPLEGDIAAEAEHDEALLLARQTPIAGGLGIVILPNPIPTPAPTVIALLPTPTPAPSNPPDSEPATPIPVAPTATSAPPTSSPPTAPPPTSPPPTGAPPTVPPTGVPPTMPPTVVPPTVPPPTVPPTGVPPTVPPTEVPPTASPTVLPPTDTPTATPTPPTVNFSAAAFGVNEIEVNAVITVTLSGTSAQTVTVNFATVAGGIATEGVDYTPVNGVLTFAPGQTSQTFNIPITDDIIAGEGNETILLALTNPVNANPGLMNATLTITDNDLPPAVQFSDLTYNAGEGDGSATITVILVNTTSALPVTVNYATADGSATSGSDYTGVSGILTFAPGTTSLTFTVSITDDALFEGPDPERVNLALSNPSVNATLGTPNQATLYITDNDLAPPTVSFSALSYTVAEDVAGGIIQIPVQLNAAAGVTVTVDYTTTDWTATAGSDYTATNGALTFPPLVTSQVFTVTILGDTVDEPDEVIRLTLSNPNPGSVIVGPPATLMILDNDNAGICPGDYTDPDEPNIGTPDGDFARIECGVAMIIDLGSTPIETGHPGFDLTYYEVQGVGGPPPAFPTIYYIYMDLVQVQISQTPNGPPSSWFTVFEWGDNIIDTNTNIGGTYVDTGSGVDNMLMYGPLYGPLIGPGDPYNTGIAIDIDNLPAVLPVVPSGTYRYVRIFSPNTGDTDGPEVDAIQVCLPDCP